MLIIHGENQKQSRQYFIDQKQRKIRDQKQIVERSGDDLTLAEIHQTINTASLFGDVPCLVIEQLFSRRPSTEKKQLLEYLAANQSADIVIWEGKEIAPGQLKDFQPINIKLFPLPKYLFDFLDTLSLDSFHKTVDTAPVEQVFASLVTRLHKVITGEGKIKKTLSQTQILSAYKQLLAIDYAQKTSSSAYDLATALELWLIKL